MSFDTLDTNVSNYTLSEILEIADLTDDDSLTKENILQNTNKFIKKYYYEDPTIAAFFTEIQSQLLQYIDATLETETGTENKNNHNNKSLKVKNARKTKVGETTFVEGDEIYAAGQKQTDDRYENEYLRQSDHTQTKKITERKQKIQVFGNQHVPMTREQLGVNDTFAVSVKQDSLNPNLQNTITRFVNLDSQFRQTSGGAEASSTNYTLDLSDRLNNTLSLCLYSYQIPNTWYVIDVTKNNTCFWIIDTDSNITVKISIASGNYTGTQLANILSTTILKAGFHVPLGATSFPEFVEYNSLNGKMTISLYGTIYRKEESTFHVTEKTQILFFDFTATLQCENYACGSITNPSSLNMNQSLGWVIGFRTSFVYINPDGNTVEAAVDLNGTKYLILVIDDFNQNRVNNGLVTITELSSKLKLPNYYTPLQPRICRQIRRRQRVEEQTLLQQEEEELAKINSGNFGNVGNVGNFGDDGMLLAEKYFSSTFGGEISGRTSIPVVVPSAPRTLTQSQLYTINEILKNKTISSTNYRPKAPTSSDIMAILPLKGGSSSVPIGTLLAEFSGSLQQNIRTYFGPVNIDRMAVKLLDDQGNQLNLNGCDWCVTLIATCLYQY